MELIVKAFIAALTTAFILLLWCLVGVLPTWLLWNWLMPSIFRLREITFLETFGLLMLSGLLIKSHSGSKS